MKGTLTGIEGSWGSGLAQLLITDEQGKQLAIPCENGPTVRALDAMLGNVMDEGHCASIKTPVAVEYTLDDMGLILASIRLAE